MDAAPTPELSPRAAATPLPISLANRVGSLWRRARPDAALLDANDLLAAARKEAGLHDFGDGTFREGLDMLVHALNADAGLTPVGQALVRRYLTGLLVGRLRVRDFAKKSEVVDYEVITAPLLVCGLPHTGMGRLSDLLDQDPLTRSVTGWEADNVAPPVTLDAWRSDPRLAAAVARSRGPARLGARFGLTAERGLTAPADCAQLLAGAFASTAFETIAHVPEYRAWRDICDMVPAYRHHHLQLRVLQSTVPVERWSLRSAAHLGHLDAVRAVYPDARIVWLHRDPARVTTSLTSATVSMRRIGAADVDPGAVAQECRATLLEAARRGTGAIDRWPESQVFHLQYAEFVEDPVGTVERVYRTFGLELPEVGRRRMQLWNDEQLGRRRGTDDSPDAFGLDAAELRRDFGDYISEFRVPAELG